MIILQKQNVERIVTSEDEAAKLETVGFKRLSEQLPKAVAPKLTPPATNKEPPKVPTNPKSGKSGKGNAAAPKSDAATSTPPASPAPENGGGADGAKGAGADNEGCAGQSETPG